MSSLRVPWLVCVAATGVWAAPAEIVHRVAQPLWAEGVGVVIAEVPYVREGTPHPGAAVLLTLAASSVSTDSGFEDRNLARRMGLEVRLAGIGRTPPGPGAVTWPGVYGDTLRVTLDLTSAALPADVMGEATADDVVAATVECLQRNAARGWPQLRVLQLRVVGSPEHEVYSDWYDLMAPGEWADADRATAEDETRSDDLCSRIHGVVSPVPGTVTEVVDGVFRDDVAERDRPGCLIVISGSWTELGGEEDPARRLVDVLMADGWTQILEYEADGPDGTQVALARDEALCIVRARWDGGDDSEPDALPGDIYQVTVLCTGSTDWDGRP